MVVGKKKKPPGGRAVWRFDFCLMAVERYWPSWASCLSQLPLNRSSGTSCCIFCLYADNVLVITIDHVWATENNNIDQPSINIYQGLILSIYCARQNIASISHTNGQFYCQFSWLTILLSIQFIMFWPL